MDTQARVTQVIYADIDVSKASLDVDTYPVSATKQFPNDDASRTAVCAQNNRGQTTIIFCYPVVSHTFGTSQNNRGLSPIICPRLFRLFKNLNVGR
ncbi:MAG: hypothetical protein ING51_12265 [Rhodocyclaceae bacterium]|jgi:hypothetical protein|nr:hypothetical protein [Rhodocyclaceae bacterium]MCA3053132.1 hypothetical protein [Rhodocyclaceae bacterium]